MRSHCRARLHLLRLSADRLARRLQPAAWRMQRSSDYRSHIGERSNRAIRCSHLLPRNCTAGRARSPPWRHFHFGPSERLLLHYLPCWLHPQWLAQPAHCMLASIREVLRKQLYGGTAATFVSVQGSIALTSYRLLWSLLPSVCMSSSASRLAVQQHAPLSVASDGRHRVPSVRLSAEMCSTLHFLPTRLCPVRFPLASPPRSKQHSLAAT